MSARAASVRAHANIALAKYWGKADVARNLPAVPSLSLTLAGMTIYPVSKCTPQRAVDMLEMHGADRLCVNAAADLGVSDPLQTHRTLLEARRRGHPRDTLLQVFHNNPATFFGQNPRFRPRPLRVTELPSAAPGRPL